MRRRTKLRRGRYLPAMEVAPIVKEDPNLSAMHEMLTSQGYMLRPTQRFYLAKTGIVTMRFVWRCRRDNACASVEIVRQVDVSGLLSWIETQKAERLSA